MKKKLLICGASKNLGMFLSNKFTLSGHNVLKLSKKLKTNLSKNIYQCDLEDNHKSQATLQKIYKKHKYLDGIIFSVGNSKPRKNSKFDSEKYISSLKVNLISLVIFLENYLKIFKKKKLKLL